jgi:hypothetical protein
MPKAHDQRAAQLAITHHPTARIPFERSKLPDFKLQDLIDGTITMIKTFTGIDLSSWDNFIASLSDGKGIDLPGIGPALNTIGILFGGITFEVAHTVEEVWSNVISTIINPLGLIKGIDQWLRETIVGALDFDHDGDVDLDDVGAALRKIPAPNILGYNVGETIADTLQYTWDHLWRGLTGLTGSGKSVSEMASAAAQLQLLTQNHEETLGLRGNRPGFAGYDSSIEAVFPVSQIPDNAHTHWLAVDPSWIPMGFIRANQRITYGKVSWLGYNTTGLTTLIIDVFKMNAGGGLDFVMTSGNILSEVSATLAWNTWDFDELPAVPGDIFGIRMRVTRTGSTPYYLAGTTQASNPTMGDSNLKALAAQQTSTSTATITTIAWNPTEIPWFGLGLGDVGYHTPVLVEYPTAGTYTYTVPSWAKYVDVIALGGGGGGHAGYFTIGNGGGGHSGVWKTQTLQRGVDFGAAVTSMTVTVGAGGAGGNVTGVTAHSGAAGANTTIAFTDPSSATTTVTATGGLGGTDISPGNATGGDSPGNTTYIGRTFYGGPGSGTTGNSPGGGGAGGNSGSSQWGADGAAGVCWLNARQD